MAYGLDAVVSINFQNSFGTAITNDNYFLPVLSNGVVLKKEAMTDTSLKGIYDVNGAVEGKNSNEGAIELQSDSLAIGVMLRALCGAATVITSGSLRTHSFKPSQQGEDFDEFIANPPVTIITDLDVGSAQVFYDMCATGIELNISNGEFVKATQNYIGGKYTRVNPPTANYQDENLFPWDVTSVSFDGTANCDFGELTITIEEGIENKYNLCVNKTPSYTKRSDIRTIMISGTVQFNDQVEFDEFISQTERQLVVTLNSGTEVQSGYTESIKIDMPSFRYNTFEPSVGGPGLIEASIEGQAVYNSGSATAIEFTLTNTQAAY